ncbi:hypothetical protein TNCV_4969441 [Trichonephila clavipes]|nr:hypothetical protein TNCV_4969441 [Trichonephila clavipes]
MALVIFNHDQVTRTTPELASPRLTTSPPHINRWMNELSTDLTCIAALLGGSSAKLVSNSRHSGKFAPGNYIHNKFLTSSFQTLEPAFNGAHRNQTLGGQGYFFAEWRLLRRWVEQNVLMKRLEKPGEEGKRKENEKKKKRSSKRRGLVVLGSGEENPEVWFRDADQRSKTRIRKNALRTGSRQAVGRATSKRGYHTG